MEISKEFRFEASHMLPRHPGKCRRLHGHSWVLKVTLSGPVNKETGFVMDYSELSENMVPLIESLDHHHLGTWDSDWLPYNGDWDAHTPEGFYPSSENLLLYIAERMSASYEPEAKWSRLELNETCTSSCVLTREEYERITGASVRSVEAKR
jgi:6-pyruvoyltetrahydropterin/6-carboxytetrahydropterin synthase